MSYPKIVGLALVAALMAMALAGAGTAAATTLCSTTSCASTYPVGTVLHLETETPVAAHTPIGSFECKKWTYQGKTTTAGSSTETVKGAVESTTFSECSGCAWSVLKNGSWEIHTDKEDARTTGESGTLTSSGTELTGECLGFHCIWTTANTSFGTITGGAPATLDTAAVIPRSGGRSGAFCGSTATWTGSYKVTKPIALWIK
jgi:hypothetical protein